MGPRVHDIASARAARPASGPRVLAHTVATDGALVRSPSRTTVLTTRRRLLVMTAAPRTLVPRAARPVPMTAVPPWGGSWLAEGPGPCSWAVPPGRWSPV